MIGLGVMGAAMLTGMVDAACGALTGQSGHKTRLSSHRPPFSMIMGQKVCDSNLSDP
jgi:hypothetical protein